MKSLVYIARARAVEEETGPERLLALARETQATSFLNYLTFTHHCSTEYTRNYGRDTDTLNKHASSTSARHAFVFRFLTYFVASSALRHRDSTTTLDSKAPPSLPQHTTHLPA